VLGLADLELLVVELFPKTDQQPRIHRLCQTTHVQLLALKDVTVGAAGLTGPGRDDGKKTTGLELLLKEGVDLGVLFALSEDTLDVVGLLGGLSGLGLTLGEDGLGATEKGLGVVSLVPLPEGSGIDLNDTRLDESLGTEELVVRGVVTLSKSTL
jgi:hypothetical protein